jgi:molybdopterin-containing oxidoreductase family iron-sulfur binding subunit
MYDGRYANNVWLQELPHPMTKLTWDNAVHVSPATARRLNLKNQERVELRLHGRTVRGSVWISPGHPENSVLIHLGYGRSKSGRAGNGAGFSAYKLRTSDALWAADGAEVFKINESYPLATTQMHQFMEGRDVALSLTVDHYRQQPDYLREKLYEPAPNETLYPRWLYSGYAWGMSIDQTACVNCNACVIACQAENNIPVVGKSQVLMRRAMHWLRVDTYYEGNLENPSAHYQPIPCMQCENAPCELVCPVQAQSQQRWPERHGLQPLRRHALLLEQLSLQSPPLQLSPLRRLENGSLETAAQSGCHRAQPRRYGEMHILRAKNSRGGNRCAYR